MPFLKVPLQLSCSPFRHWKASKRCHQMCLFHDLIYSGRVSHYRHHHRRRAQQAGTDTPCWPITLQIWPPYPKKANDAAARGSYPTVRHGWTAQAAGKHQHCDKWLLDFLAEGAETTVRDREENPELCPSCVSPHTHAVLRRV